MLPNNQESVPPSMASPMSNDDNHDDSEEFKKGAEWAQNMLTRFLTTRGRDDLYFTDGDQVESPDYRRSNTFMSQSLNLNAMRMSSIPRPHTSRNGYDYAVDTEPSIVSGFDTNSDDDEWGNRSDATDITYFSDVEDSIPDPIHHFTLNTEKEGLLHLDHMGVPFPRIRDHTLYFGDTWKGWLETVKKRWRLPQGEWSVSLFFKVSEGINLQKAHLPLLSQGELKEHFSVWVTCKKDTPYLYVSVPCVKSIVIAKVPLESEERKATDWHHIFIKFRRRKLALMLDSQEAILKDIYSKEKNNKFKTHAKPLKIGHMSKTNKIKRKRQEFFFHGQMYSLKIWNTPLSFSHMKEVQKEGFEYLEKQMFMAPPMN